LQARLIPDENLTAAGTARSGGFFSLVTDLLKRQDTGPWPWSHSSKQVAQLTCRIKEQGQPFGFDGGIL
jgi:hypothetical protein